MSVSRISPIRTSMYRKIQHENAILKNSVLPATDKEIVDHLQHRNEAVLTLGVATYLLTLSKRISENSSWDIKPGNRTAQVSGSPKMQACHVLPGSPLVDNVELCDVPRSKKLQAALRRMVSWTDVLPAAVNKGDWESEGHSKRREQRLDLQDVLRDFLKAIPARAIGTGAESEKSVEAIKQVYFDIWCREADVSYTNTLNAVHNTFSKNPEQRTEKRGEVERTIEIYAMYNHGQREQSDQATLSARPHLLNQGKSGTALSVMVRQFTAWEAEAEKPGQKELTESSSNG